MPKYKRKPDEFDLIKIGGGWQYFCVPCQKKYRYKQLVEKLE